MTSNIAFAATKFCFGIQVWWDVCIFSKNLDDADDDEIGFNGSSLYKEVPYVVRPEL